MATRNIVPRADGEGTLGTTLKNWLNGFFKYFTISNYIKFLSVTAPSHEEGILFYDNLCKMLTFYTEHADLSLNIGSEVVLRVKNETGIDIAHGSVVKIVGEVDECVALIELAQADTMPHARGAFAITTTSVLNTGYGYATVLGQVHSLDTSLWIAGTKLYLSDTVPGGLTNVSPSISVPVATVVHSSATIGSIFIKVNETVDQLGDMLKADYDSNLNSIVDKAEALNDGTTGDGNNVTAQEARDHIDDISNPHGVTPGQIGASPTGHTHVEIDIIDLDHYTSLDFATDFGLANLANLGTKDHSSLTNKNTETDIKHITDDQKDALDNANSPDSANPVATINDLPIFGQNFEYNQSLGVSTTTSATFQNKLSFTTANLPAGTYRIGWAYGWNYDATDTDFEARLVLDGDTDINDLLMFHTQEPSDNGGAGSDRYAGCGTNQIFRNSGFRYITFTSPGTHTIVLAYRTTTAGVTTSIFDAIVELWRVE